MAYSHQLTRVIKLIGPQATIKLARQYGGREYQVPSIDTLHDLHPLTVMVGLASAERLAQEFGGTYLKLPIEVNALMQIRNHAILLKFLADESIQSIASELGIDRKMVQKVLDVYEARGEIPAEKSPQIKLL